MNFPKLIYSEASYEIPLKNGLTFLMIFIFWPNNLKLPYFLTKLILMRCYMLILKVLLINITVSVHLLSSQVTVEERLLAIPTYGVLDPDPNPVFFNGRRYQGAQGRVYPYPLVHNLTDSLTDKEYRAVIIENEYIEVCILPELGGRIYYARDKGNDYYFLYYNRVVKPALIGMTGAWISGGVEWNIPHHHRATSFMPLAFEITENADGSKTVWVGETELRHRTRWAVGVTLYPSSTLIGTTLRVYNTTPYQNSFLAWANAAVHANENYQVYFPPKSQYVTYHRKNQFSGWPVSYQFYDGADYSEGVDVSRWENHIKPTSFFEWGNNGNFVAGIDHAQQAGTVVFGDKYINPGKKVWSWGNNPQGAMWDQLLTDEDGPYLELMFGSFSDNQPDYSWIHTRETKESEYWFAPLRDMTGISRVNRDAVVHLDILNDTLFAGINVTRPQEGARIIIREEDEIILDETTSVYPDSSFLFTYEAPGMNKYALKIELFDNSGKLLIDYRPEEIESRPVPEPVSSPKGAGEINDPDSLYFAGLRFEQFHDPYYMPLDYYLRALELSPGHIPSQLRAGLLKMKSGMFKEAAGYLGQVAERVTGDYTVPESGASLFYLALAYNELGREREAYELFYRASWDYAFHSAARYELARTDSRRGNYSSALYHLRHAWSTNTRSIDILSLMTTMYRLSGDRAKAVETAGMLLELDPLNPRAHYENFTVTGDRRLRQEFERLMTGHHENYLELAAGYGNDGLYDDAVNVLEHYTRLTSRSIKDYPMIFYYLGYYNHLKGNESDAIRYFNNAASGHYGYGFPFRPESLKVLDAALEHNSGDALAWYLKGNLLYDHQPDNAIEAWERSVSISDRLPAAYRNLAFASANIGHDPDAAIRYIEKALEINPSDPRYYFEYDLYRRSLLAGPAERVKIFLDNHDVVISDQLTIFPYAGLLTMTGRYDEAIDLMGSRNFHRWEGGESIYHFWLYANLFKAVDALENNQLAEADTLLNAALSFPPNLQSVTDAHETIAWYYKGILAERRRQPGEAQEFFMKAADCRSSAPECDYFAAKAYERMQKAIAAQSIFEYMVEGGEAELLAEDEMDFFDPFARVKSAHELQANAYLKIALGYHGLGEQRNAQRYFQLAREHNPDIMSLVFGR